MTGECSRRTHRLVKSTVLILGGLTWIVSAVALGVFLYQYMVQGAGLQVIGLGVSSTSVLVGLAHFVGIVAAAGLCFVIGVGLCVHGLVPLPVREPSGEQKATLHGSSK